MPEKKIVTFFTVIILALITVVDSFENSHASQTNNVSSCWTRGKNMPTARIEMASVTVNDKIYVIGGYTDRPTDLVEVYDTVKDEWGIIPSLPEKLDHLAAAAYNNKIYVVGGFDEGSNPNNKLFIYDTLLGKWEEGKNLPTGRGALTAEFINGILYATGGDIDPSYIAGGYHPYGQTNTNEAYDPSTDSWEVKTPMPTARHHHSAAVVGEKLYVIGGRYGLAYANHIFNNTDANEMYDPVQNKWHTVAAIPTSRSGATAATVNGSIYVLGGETKNYPTETQHTYAENEKYEPSTNIWVPNQSMTVGKHGLIAESVNNKIFVIGGGTKPGFTVDDRNEIYNVALIEKNNCL